jgi:hypothetical protein
MSPMRPLPPALPPASASGSPDPTTRSALVVSHHLDGFLRTWARGLVASRCRSWGSPRFAHPWPPRGRSLATVYGKRSPRRGSHPSKNPPRPQPYRVTTALAFMPLPIRRPTGAPVHRDGPPHRPF